MQTTEMNQTIEDVNAIMFDEEHLQSRLTLMRQYVARPIPKQPWDDSTPALIPFHDGDNASGGGIIIAGSRHAANIPLLQSLNVTAVLNCASGVSNDVSPLLAAMYAACDHLF